MARVSRRIAFAGIITLAFASGCETFYPPVNFVPAKGRLADTGIGVAQSTSNRRFAYIVEGVDSNNNKKIFIYSEPPPDTAVQAAAEFAGKMALPSGASAELKASIANTILQLTNRTQAVVLLRDSLFRLAEASSNGVISSADYKTEFENVLNNARIVALADADRAAAQKSNAVSVQKLTEKLSATTNPTSVSEIISGIKLLNAGGDGTGPRQ